MVPSRIPPLARYGPALRTLSARFRQDQAGATAIEYTLIAVVLALAVFGSMSGLTSAVNTLFNTVNTSFDAAR
ncbi:Flp family type IVb pilin [Methylobacterium organophilum]|uniref:Flp family type IVb pilin n=1 Tax=Methylobacterium organophilum TaxID=410 RepID=A0ABQ4TFL7_METOR|nr:Flp family type IVb pilin [Methylobacterium organophilum]UMY16191.1 Flp family type IVb pilin [Methylobacterium organophilum]GJE28837.1 hypothetical protein LKMONMHP_3711 [Methylobacterium organophilum]